MHHQTKKHPLQRMVSACCLNRKIEGRGSHSRAQHSVPGSSCFTTRLRAGRCQGQKTDQNVAHKKVLTYDVASIIVVNGKHHIARHVGRHDTNKRVICVANTVSNCVCAVVVVLVHDGVQGLVLSENTLHDAESKVNITDPSTQFTELPWFGNCMTVSLLCKSKNGEA